MSDQSTERGPFGLELEMVPRGCALQPYTPVPVPAFQFRGEMIAYASPDSTYAVTRRLIERARRSILIGIYDFTAPYMRDLLIAAQGRGVRVSVMLDLDKRKGEPELWEDLKQAGIETVPAPSCASEHARYFASSHEKVIIVDDEWTLVQSGNYSENSIPKNETDGGDPGAYVPGNRDMGVAVRSPELAAFLASVLRRDMQLELDAALRELPALAPLAAEPLELLMEAPPQPPPQLYPSRRFRPTSPVAVQPVLSPENYMALIPDLLAGARQSIYIEQQYIRGYQPQIAILLEAIGDARRRNPALSVRIVLAWPFEPNSNQERRSRAALTAAGLKAGQHVRYLNRTYFTHCHNKLIIVDRQRVLVSSQNWSDAAVTRNREAGLLISYAPLARYYGALFALDWRTAVRQGPDGTEAPAEAELPFGSPGEAVPGTRLLPVSLGDYVEV
ncbi:MAG: phospholipase D-like domain-containing protein [Chloroflexota bacterium]